MSTKFIYNTCNKSVSCRNLIECSLYLTIVHLKCNNLNVVDEEITKNTGSDRFSICMFCSNNLFPFAILNDHKLYQTLAQRNNHYSGSSNSYSTHTCSTLKPPKNLSNLFNEFNNVSSQQNKNNKNIINCKYYNIKEIQSLYNLNHKNALSLFHINTCSLSKNIEELVYLLDKTKKEFVVIGISESRVKKDKSPTNSISLKAYSPESCLEESASGGIPLYITHNLSYKPRNNLFFYKSTELESTFMEILSRKKTNVIVSCIYRHPHMDLNEFNDYNINNLLDKLSNENKTVFLLENFNVKLLNYDQHSLTNEFLGSLFSHMLLPHLVQPTRIRNNSKTITDKIYSNVITPNNISGNITATVSDHLPQFLIAPDILSNPPSTKLNIFERAWSKFDQENFMLDYLSVDWENLIKSNCGNVNQSGQIQVNLRFLCSSYKDFQAKIKVQK